jgi:hypothetical protein
VIALALACFVAAQPAALAGDNGCKVTYDGGSLPDTKSETGVSFRTCSVKRLPVSTFCALTF